MTQQPQRPEQAHAVEALRAWGEDPAVREQYGDDFHKYAVRKQWEGDPDLRTEFQNDFESYAAYVRAVKKGLVGPIIGGRIVTQ